MVCILHNESENMKSIQHKKYTMNIVVEAKYFLWSIYKHLITVFETC